MINFDKIFDKFWINFDKILNENNHLKQLLERFNPLLNRTQPSALVKQVSRLMHGADPESWDGD